MKALKRIGGLEAERAVDEIKPALATALRPLDERADSLNECDLCYGPIQIGPGDFWITHDNFKAIVLLGYDPFKTGRVTLDTLLKGGLTAPDDISLADIAAAVVGLVAAQRTAEEGPGKLYEQWKDQVLGKLDERLRAIDAFSGKSDDWKLCTTCAADIRRFLGAN